MAHWMTGLKVSQYIEIVLLAVVELFNTGWEILIEKHWLRNSALKKFENYVLCKMK